jgi:hypothetical protein
VGATIGVIFASISFFIYLKYSDKCNYFSIKRSNKKKRFK